jgi:N utilization substance protein B
MKRRTAREKAVQCLFQLDMGHVQLQDALELVLENTQGDPTYLRQLVEETLRHQQEIDQEIVKYLRGWQLERIANVDRAILRLAFYELMFEKDVPYKVVVNEAVELAKLFSDEQSSRFVNGVLSSYVQSLESAES